MGPFGSRPVVAPLGNAMRYSVAEFARIRTLAAIRLNSGESSTTAARASPAERVARSLPNSKHRNSIAPDAGNRISPIYA